MIRRVACLSALGGVLFGYDLGLIGVAILSLKDSLHLGDSEQEAIIGAAKFGAVWGTFIGGTCMLCYGRVRAIAIGSVFFTLGPLTMAASQGFWGVVVGRVIAGLGIGASAVVVPAYLGEIAPAKHRGAVVQVYEVALCVGMFLSTFIDYALRGVPGDWRWMVGLPAIPGAIMGLSTFYLPESARWLALHGYPISQHSITQLQLAEVLHEVHVLRQRGEAQLSVDAEASPSGGEVGSRLLFEVNTDLGPSSPVDLAVRQAEDDTTTLLHAQTESMGKQRNAGAPRSFLPTLTAMLSDIVRVARGPERSAFCVAMVLAFFNQASASSSVVMYAPSVLARYDTRLNEAILFSSLVAVTKTLGVLAGMLAVDRLGRRPLLLAGSLACGVAHIGATWALAAHSMLGTLAAFCLFIFSFSSSWAGGFWVLLSEMFSLEAKSPAASSATAFLFLTGSLINLVFLSSMDLLGPCTFLILAAVCFAAALFVWCKLPETRGCTLLEVQALMAAGSKRQPHTTCSDADLSVA